MFTLLFAVDHHEAELAREAADGTRGQRQQGAEVFSVRLTETDHGVRSTGGSHILAPFQALYPRQRTLETTQDFNRPTDNLGFKSNLSLPEELTLFNNKQVNKKYKTLCIL